MSNQQSCPNSDRDAWCGPWCRHPAVGTVRSRNPQSYCRGSWILGGLPQTRTLWLPPVQPAAQLFSPAVALVPPAKPSQILHVQVHPWWSQQDEKEAFQLYLQKFGECRDGSNPGYSRKAFPWYSGKLPQGEKVSDESLQAALAYRPQPAKRLNKPNLVEVDSEGEEVPLCTKCSMPVGEFAYQGREGKHTCVHTECMAQVLMKEAQRDEELRNQREQQKKILNRREFDIGWQMDSVPQNARWAARMGCDANPQGLCCLVLDEASRTVKVKATLEPSAAVNLEYLLLALKVRKTASREPLFSLDPVDPQNLEQSPQKKVYEPKWLAGTSAGDVMFQADYFLKELALGEYSMPVVGMSSVFDFSEMTGKENQWAGREWFVVRKAEVRMAEDKTLIPHVKMGVEAREQVLTKNGLEDAPVTLPHHPLKKFAEAFSRHFDLIAERKSVIFHLRELAKASVMAKYLVDSRARVDPSWYALADEIVKTTTPEAHPEIPQLWNMRGNSRIKLKNGRLIDMVTGGQSSLQAIYGGVEFGLDRFELAQRHALQGQPGMQLGQSGRPMFMPQRFQLGQREMPQGVDLNLDKFSLSSEERFAGRLPPCSGGKGSLEAKVTLGKVTSLLPPLAKAFLDGLRSGVKADDQNLLVNIFTVPQCDRVEEGDAFIPPDPTLGAENLEYVQKLRNIVGEERSIRERRKTRFADKNFVMANPGSDFPRSWTSRFQVELEGRISYTAPTKFGLVKLDVEESFKRSLLQEVMPNAVPEFQQTTEDGIIFRIYKLGSLEVRTIQEPEAEEQVHQVFSARAACWNSQGSKTEALRLKALLERHHSQPKYLLGISMSWKGRWGSNARAEAWKGSWPKENKKPQEKSKKEKPDNQVLRYHDGTKIDTTVGGSSTLQGSSAQSSLLQEENKKLREAIKALSQKADLSEVESADEIRKLVETDPREVLREQQKELNKLKKELTKKEKIERQLKEKAENHASWKAGILEGVKRADIKHLEEIKKLKEELAQVEDDKDVKDGMSVEVPQGNDSAMDSKLEDMDRKMYQMASYVETMEQRNQDLAYQAEPEKFPTVETIVILTQQMLAQMTKEEFDLEEESFRQALAELPSTLGGSRDLSACLIPANEGKKRYILWISCMLASPDVLQFSANLEIGLEILLDERYQYYHDIPIVGGTFVKLHEFPHESEASTTCDSVSPASSATWDDNFLGDNTATPEGTTPTLDVHGHFDPEENTATSVEVLRDLTEDQSTLFQTYAVPRIFQVDWPQDFAETTETEEELEELMDMLSFHTSVFGFERLNDEVLAYREAFGHFPTFEALYVDDRLEDSTFLFHDQDWSREAFVATVRLFLETMIDRNEFSAIAFVQEIPTPYEQGGNDHIFVIVEKSYAPLRVMICVVITFDLDDSPEIYALSVPQYVWSKDLVRDLQMEAVCRDPRFDCLLRHGLLEMPVVVAWQPYQGMKLNLDIKMLTCSSQVPRFHIMTSQVLEVGNPSENMPEDGVSLMQQARILDEENDMPTTLSTQRADTESLCNGYSSRGPTDIAPHFMSQAQQLEELRRWLWELMGNEDSIALYVFERNGGDVSTYRILLRAEVLGGQPRFAHWIRRELAALWNVHARIFPLLPAPFTDLRIAVLLPRAFGLDLPVLLEINDGQDSWREIHIIQQAVTINSLIWRSRLPAIVPSTLSYQAMLVGEMADPNDLVPCSPGQWITILVGALGHLGANGTTISSLEPGLPSLTSLASSQSNSIRPGVQLEEPVDETGEDALDEHTIMQLPMGRGSDAVEVFSWFLGWDQRDSIQQQSRTFSFPRDTDLESRAIQTWNDICSSDHPLVVLISPFIQEAGFRPPAVLVVEYINQLYQPVFIDLETSDTEAKGGFLLRDLQAMCTNDIFDQVLPQHRCRTVANCFVRLQGHWYEWDEDIQIRAGDYLQMLEYTESDDEHSTLCGSERQDELAFSETSEESDCLQFLQLEVWHREAGTGLPPPGNGVYWESKCLDAMDDLLHCPDGDHVVDFRDPSRRRPIPTPARSGVLPRVVSISDALIDDRAPELQIPLGLSATEIELLMDFDPVAEQLETLFDGSDLDEYVHQMFQAAPKCIPDRWNPADSHSVRIFTDGSYINGSAAWSFVVVACYCDRQDYVGYQSGAIPLQGHPDCLLDTHGSAVCAEQHALIWASWWLLRYWRLAALQTPIVFLWDSQVAGRQAEGLYGAASALGRLLRGLQIALQQLTPADVGHLHVPAHRGHLYNEVADTLAKQAHGKCPACPDAGLLLQMVQKLGHLDHLWLFVHQSPMIPPGSHGNIRWKPTSATAFPKELLIAQLLPGSGKGNMGILPTTRLEYECFTTCCFDYRSFTEGDENGDTLQTMEEVNARWVRHFAQLEAGKEVEVQGWLEELGRQTHKDDVRHDDMLVADETSRREISCRASHKEKLSKCKMYIEAYEHEACNNFYMVLETEEKSLVVTERLANGSLSWKENPQNLEDRNSLAKLLFTVDCKENMLLGEVVRHFEELPSDSSLDCRKHYAKALYKFVSGRNLRGKWGGSPRPVSIGSFTRFGWSGNCDPPLPELHGDGCLLLGGPLKTWRVLKLGCISDHWKKSDWLEISLTPNSQSSPTRWWLLSEAGFERESHACAPWNRYT
ncbi:unnamed protein product [Durusdinium trenchii]|uniref:RNase H type-1 domain-containing protein n=1 Tax=Durusdinium trenchii TaxID=1381693 RepID=A0ABP0K5X1_9DINO